jgi:hypothetical protein
VFIQIEVVTLEQFETQIDLEVEEVHEQPEQQQQPEMLETDEMVFLTQLLEQQ